jgi:hypothetical protein
MHEILRSIKDGPIGTELTAARDDNVRLAKVDKVRYGRYCMDCTVEYSRVQYCKVDSSYTVETVSLVLGSDSRASN